MPSVHEVVAIFRADTRQFTSALDSAAAKTEAVGAKTSKAGALITGAYAAAGVGVALFAVKSVKAFEENQQALVQMQSAFRNNPALVGASAVSFDKLAQSIQNVTGVSRTSIDAAVAVGARFVASGAQLQEFTKDAVNLSVKMGIDVPEAATKMGLATLGNARALKALGIDTVTFNAHLKTLTTQEQKVAYVMSVMEPRIRGIADAMGKTFSGQVNILKGRLNDLAITTGKALVPALNALLPIFGALISQLPKIIAGFLALKVVTSLTTGLKALGIAFGGLTGGAFGEFLGLASAIVPVLAGAAAATVGFVGLITIFADRAKNANQGLFGLMDTIKQYGTTSTKGAAAADTLKRSLLGVRFGAYAGAVAVQQAAAAHQSLGTAAGLVASDEAALVPQVKTATDTLNKQKSAVLGLVSANLELAGGFLGIQGAELSTVQSQLALTQATQQYHKDLKDKHTTRLQLQQDLLSISQAQLTTVTSQEQLSASILDYASKQVKAGASTNMVVGEVRAFARQAGLTKGQTDALTNSVLDLINKDRLVPKSVKTLYSTPGLAAAIADILAYRNHLLNIPARIDTTVRTFYQSIYTVSGTQQKRGATGGAFAAAGGALVAAGGHMFRAGEGAYATPLGTGAELVSERGVLPLNNAMIQRLGQAIAEAMRSSNATTNATISVYGNTDVNVLAEAISRRLARRVA